LGRNDLLIRTFPKVTSFIITALILGLAAYGVKNGLQ
ncbi:TPA: hypothetical protein ACIDCO_005052, partial [Shigella sonnei]